MSQNTMQGSVNQSQKPQPTAQAAQAQKPKRSRKTIDQQLASLEEKKRELVEQKRKEETRKKIIFGASVFAWLKNLRERGNRDAVAIVDAVLNYTNKTSPKDMEMLLSVTNTIMDTKPKQPKGTQATRPAETKPQPIQQATVKVQSR